MRKVVALAGAALVLVCVAPAFAQTPPSSFRDMDESHWAWQSLERLRRLGIAVGYPDEYFRGRRTMSRYEVVVMVDRLLKYIEDKMPASGVGPKGDQGAQGPQGATGEKGEKGEKGDTGISPDEIATLKRLAEEFKGELASMGNNMARINARLDQMAKDVAAMKDAWDKAPKIYGGFFLGARVDRAQNRYVDYMGRPFRHFGEGLFGRDLTNSAAVVHDLTYGVKAKIAGGGVFQGELTTNTYKEFVGGNIAVVDPFGFRSTSPRADTYVRRATFTVPFGGLGQDGELVLGRFPNKVTPLTLWRIDPDKFLVNSNEYAGAFMMDGFKLSTKFGSVGADIFAAKTESVTPNDGSGWNSPIAGAASAQNSWLSKPFGQGNLFDEGGAGQMLVNQIAGVGLSVHLAEGLLGTQGGKIRVNGLGMTGTGGRIGATPYDNVVVVASDVQLGITDRVNFSGEWSKTIPGQGRFGSISSSENNAFSGKVMFGSGGLNLAAGYKYIDPLFYAPGYWGRIGNWINPTNVQGPTFRASYDFSPNFGVNVGGDFYSAARNRGPVGLDNQDCINRILAGVRWDVSKNFHTTVDWEGVYYTLDNRRFDEATGKVHPVENYVTIGTGYNLTSTSVLKMAWTIGGYNGKRALSVAGLDRYNFNSFTTTFGLKF